MDKPTSLSKHFYRHMEKPLVDKAIKLIARLGHACNTKTHFDKFHRKQFDSIPWELCLQICKSVPNIGLTIEFFCSNGNQTGHCSLLSEWIFLQTPNRGTLQPIICLRRVALYGCQLSTGRGSLWLEAISTAQRNTNRELTPWSRPAHRSFKKPIHRNLTWNAVRNKDKLPNYLH